MCAGGSVLVVGDEALGVRYCRKNEPGKMESGNTVGKGGEEKVLACQKRGEVIVLVLSNESIENIGPVQAALISWGRSLALVFLLKRTTFNY